MKRKRPKKNDPPTSHRAISSTNPFTSNLTASQSPPSALEESAMQVEKGNFLLTFEPVPLLHFSVLIGW